MLLAIRIQLDRIFQALPNDSVGLGALPAEIREGLDSDTPSGAPVKRVIENRRKETLISTKIEAPGATRGRYFHRVGRINHSELQERELIGRGTFGIVSSGLYMGKAVAIKKAEATVLDDSSLASFRYSIGLINARQYM